MLFLAHASGIACQGSPEPYRPAMPVPVLMSFRPQWADSILRHGMKLTCESCLPGTAAR